MPGLPGIPEVPYELVDSNGSLRGGLGITGNGSLLTNIIGSDPLTGSIADALGENNAADHFLGAPPDPTQQGVLPGLAGALASINDGAILGNGAGVTGNGGLSQDLLGSDVIGPLLGNSGVISDNISGGNDHLLGALLQDNGPQSPVQNLLPAVPTETVGNLLSQAPALGVLGTGGLAEDVLGPHPDGNLIGTDSGVGAVLGSGNDGTLGSVLATESPPAAPVGETSTGLLNSLAGNNEPVLGDVAGNVPGGSTGDLAGTLTELVASVTEGSLPGGNLPGGDIGNTVGELLNLESGGVVETVTGAVESVTGLADLGGIAGGDGVGEVAGNLAGVGDLLDGVTEDNTVSSLLGSGSGLLGGLGGGDATTTSARGSFLRGR